MSEPRSLPAWKKRDNARTTRRRETRSREKLSSLVGAARRFRVTYLDGGYTHQIGEEHVARSALRSWETRGWIRCAWRSDRHGIYEVVR